MLEQLIFSWKRGAHLMFVLWAINILIGIPIAGLQWFVESIEPPGPKLLAVVIIVLLILLVPPVFYLLSYFGGVRLDSWIDNRDS